MPARALAIPLMKGSNSKNADVAPRRGLRNHRFTAAEADLKHDTGDRHRKQGAKIRRRRT